MSDFRLKVFHSVAQNLSFTKASQELFISQPAITKHIQELESTYLLATDTARTGLAGSPTQVVRSFVPEVQRESVAVDGTPAEQALRLVEIIEGVA